MGKPGRRVLRQRGPSKYTVDDRSGGLNVDLYCNQNSQWIQRTRNYRSIRVDNKGLEESVVGQTVHYCPQHSRICGVQPKYHQCKPLTTSFTNDRTDCLGIVNVRFFCCREVTCNNPKGC